jgi:hypothetical protein
MEQQTIKQILDIVDTVVKIGLGAIISGVATYSVTRLNHKEEKNKEIIKTKREILEQSVDNIDKYFSLYSEYISQIDGMIRDGLTPGVITDDIRVKYYLEIDGKFTASRHDRDIAISRARMIGEQEIVSALKGISNIETRFRQYVIFDKKIPDKETLNNFRFELKEIKKKYQEACVISFKSLYCNQ